MSGRFARLFIAVKMPPEVAQSLDAMIRQLAVAEAEVKWVKIKNLHLTLKFLGEVDESEIPSLIDGLQTVKSKKFTIEAGSIGLMPNIRRPRVIYADIVKGAEKLEKLAFFVEKVTISLGFEPESRKFLAHLTLGRFKGQTRLNKLLEKIDCAKGVIFGKVSVVEFYLIKSELRPEGPQYTELASIPLQ